MSSKSLPSLPTSVGHADWGDNRYFGFSVKTELAGSETIAGLVALATTGRRLAPQDRAVLDDIAVVMTVADARVWPLKMTRVVSSYGGSLAAVAAANVCLEEAYVGHWTSGEAAVLLSALRAEAPDLTVGAMREALERRFRAGTRLVGFGVPFRPEDERVRMLRECLVRRGRAELTYWRTLEAASSAAKLLRGLEPNIGLAVAAACLDLGFAPRQISLLCVALGQTDYVANAVEGAQQRPPALRRLPDECVHYVGAPKRSSPREAAPGMAHLALRYAGHRPGASLAYFTGASVDLVPGTRIDVPLEGLVIGRSAEASLRVASSQVARIHVSVRPVADGLQVDHLGSTNGIAVNECDVQTALLRAGDRLTIAGGFDFDVIAI